MRVTDLTKQSAIFRNMQNNGERLQNLSDNLASGRRINKLSDDPLGATQAQDFRTKLSYFNMLKENTKRTFVWLDRTESELSHIGDLLQRVKVLILAQANDSSEKDSRRVTAEELQNITKALMQSGNSKIGKLYIFAGSKTLTTPLIRGTESHKATVEMDGLEVDLKFLLDAEQFAATFRGFSSNPLRVRITRTGEIGRAHYQVSDDGGESWGRDATLLPEIEVFNRDGLSSDKVFLRFTGEPKDFVKNPIIFHEGLEFVFEANPPIQYNGNADKRMVPTSEGILQPINVTAGEIFFRDENDPDSLNIFDMMVSLKRALLDNDGRVLEERLGDLDDAFEQVLNHRADMGAVRRELEDQLKKIDDREFNNISQLSEIEDLDFPRAVMEMNLADVRNKATLDISARLIQPSLLNFLR